MLSILTIVPSHQFWLIEQQLLQCISISGSVQSQMSFGPSERLLRCALGIYSEGSPSIWLRWFIKYFLKCLKYFLRYLQYFHSERQLRWLVGTYCKGSRELDSGNVSQKIIHKIIEKARSGILYQTTKYKIIILITDKIDFLRHFAGFRPSQSPLPQIKSSPPRTDTGDGARMHDGNQLVAQLDDHLSLLSTQTARMHDGN